MLDMSVALLMALVCVLVHFEAVLLTEKILLRIPSARFSLLVSWTGFLVAHVIEIWLYALAYLACGWLGIGELHGADTLLDHAYYSAVVYTTLGFGDIVPGVGIQILTGSQALVGLSLIAWSATHTYARVTSYQAGRQYKCHSFSVNVVTLFRRIAGLPRLALHKANRDTLLRR